MDAQLFGYGALANPAAMELLNRDSVTQWQRRHGKLGGRNTLSNNFDNVYCHFRVFMCPCDGYAGRPGAAHSPIARELVRNIHRSFTFLLSSRELDTAAAQARGQRNSFVRLHRAHRSNVQQAR